MKRVELEGDVLVSMGSCQIQSVTCPHIPLFAVRCVDSYLILRCCGRPQGVNFIGVIDVPSLSFVPSFASILIPLDCSLTRLIRQDIHLVFLERGAVALQSGRPSKQQWHIDLGHIMQLKLAPTIPTVVSPNNWLSATGVAGHCAIEFSPQGVDQVHCTNGGSLLLWLLLTKRRYLGKDVPSLHPGTTTVPSQVPSVVIHGDLLLPTPASAREFASENSLSLDISEFEWRKHGLMAGVQGTCKDSPWIRPIMSSVAAGRFKSLEEVRAPEETHGRRTQLAHTHRTSRAYLDPPSCPLC